MKKLSRILIAVLALTAVISSCKKDPQEKINPVYFETFGFTTDVNADLDQDYVVSNLSRTNVINIELDAATIPGVLDTLCPVFTFPASEDGEEVIVTVADSVITSGETKMNLNNPAEFRLQKGTDNAIYTVTVTIQPSNFSLVAMAPVTDTIYTDVQASINAKDEIWVGNFLRSKDDAKKYPVLYKFANGSLGGKIILSEERSNTPVGLGLDPDGNPYLSVATYEGTKKVGSSVFKYAGGSASALGVKGSIYTFNSSNGIAVIPLSSNKVFVAGQNNSNVNTEPKLARRLLNVAEFDGSAWTNVTGPSGKITQDPAGGAYAAANAFGKILDGTAYLCVKQYGTSGTINTVSLYKNTGSTWETVVERLVFKKPDGTDIVELASYGFDFDIDSNGKPNFLIGAQFVGDTWAFTVVRYDPATQAQTILGGTMAFPVTLTERPSLEFDKNNKPYVAYVMDDGTNRVFISYIDDNTKAWVKPEPVSDPDAGDPVVLVDSKNKVYVVTDIDARVAVYAMK